MISAVSKMFNSFFKGYLPYLVIFLLALYMPGDTDLGWHLKYGEYFFQTGTILRENILSLQMPGYKWTNISWLTDIITYFIYHHYGFLGLTIAGALIVVLIFYLIDKAFHLSFWEKAFIFPLTFYLMEPLFRVSFRGQLLSTLFLAFLIFILKKFETGRKKIILLAIPLFWLWANTHGSFLLGLAVLTIFYFLRFLKHFYSKNCLDAKNSWIFLITILLSYAVTLINPYGLEIYKESFNHFGNPYQKYILEWLPLPAFSDLWWLLVFWGILLIINVRVIIDRKKFSDYFEWLIITLLFYFLSFWMRRYAWSMYLLSTTLVTFYFKEIEPVKYNFLRKTIPIVIFSAIYCYNVFYQIPRQKLTIMNWDRFCRDFIKCSPKSAEFLIENKLSGKFLSNYNWGGWLIWNYPEIKPSIDGRMHLWRDEKGYSAFANYYFLEQDVNDIDRSEYDIAYISSEKPLYKKLIQLVDAGKWKALYIDELSGVFVRNK